MTVGPELRVHLDDRAGARSALQSWLRDQHVDLVWVVAEAVDAPDPDESIGTVPVVALSPVDVAALQSEPAAPGVEVALVVFASVALLEDARSFGFTVDRVVVPHYDPDDTLARTEWTADIAMTRDEERIVQTWLDAGIEVVTQRVARVTPRPLTPPGD